jgi:hypothetical protein
VNLTSERRIHIYGYWNIKIALKASGEMGEWLVDLVDPLDN